MNYKVTLEQIIKAATIAITAAYQIYQIFADSAK